MTTPAVDAPLDPMTCGGCSWRLRLYVAGQSPKSLAALVNLKRLCDLHLADDYDIEVVDLIEHPHLAAAHQVLAIPTLVRTLPTPHRKVVGDLSDPAQVVAVLDLPVWLGGDDGQ